MDQENIIAIRRRDITQANAAFALLMNRTERALNDKAHSDKNYFCNITASALERISCDVIKEVCTGTPFNPNEVILVSGASFPDIVAQQYYGVEVKSTIKNHWTSTGSSIVESTRVKGVESIYMLFGKLGGEYAEFRCRPYQDVLSEIAVTHSPRYLIDMNLKKGDSVFDKMGIAYDTLRSSDNIIQYVRRYYRQKAENEKKAEMPWWLSNDSTEDLATSVNVRFWRDIDIQEKRFYQAQMFILFPDVLKSKFDNACLWLCTTKGILNPHMRDTFTAGGMVKTVNGQVLDNPRPQVFKKLVDSMNTIMECFECEDFLNTQVMEFNPALLNGGDTPFANWISCIHKITKDKSLVEWMVSGAILK